MLPPRAFAGGKPRPHPLQHDFHRGLCGSELLRIARTHNKIGIATRFLVHERIGADDHVRVLFGDGAELGADIALAAVGTHGFRQHPCAGLKLWGDVFQHRLHDVRHARHDDDVADPKARRRRNLVENELGADRHPRHAHARLVHDAAGLRNALGHDLDRARVMLDGNAERLGDAIGGDVVMGRADATGGEDIGIARPQRVERGDDLRLFVGDDAHFLEIDADVGEILGDVADVLVLGAAGQNLVADDKQGGGDDPNVRFGRAVGHGLQLRAAV
jgi:hypothetical protein